MPHPQWMHSRSGHTVARVMDDGSTYTKLSTEKCNSIGFRDLCERFEQVQNCPNGKRKLNILFSKSLYQNLHVHGQSVYPLMRLVLPRIDRERGSFGVQVKSLINLYTHVLGFTKLSSAAVKLRNWKLPNHGTAGSGKQVLAGNFPSILEQVLENRVGSEKRLTIGEVNERLDELCKITDTNKRRNWLMRIIRDCSAVEHKWLVRIILKEVRIGLNEDRVLNFYHPDALEMYNTCTDLRKVLDTLTDTSVRVSQQILIGEPFTPMLAKRLQHFTVKKAMKTSAFVMEPKLDGERIICHKNGNRVFLFTRNGNDYSANYLPNLNKYIQQNVRAEQCILDGEILAWDDTIKQYTSFGANRTVANNQQQHQLLQEYQQGASNSSGPGPTIPFPKLSRWMVYVVFDILYVKTAHAGIKMADGTKVQDDELLMTKSLAHRHKVLHAVILPSPKRLDIIEKRIISSEMSAEDIQRRHKSVMRYFDEVMQQNFEGLVLKDLNSTYIPGSRNGSWVKLKPDYIDQMAKTLDLLVLAGYYGHGGRGGRLSNFLLGVADRPYTANTPDSQLRFHSFCKVGTGYTMAELAELVDQLMEHAQPYDKSSSSTRPAHFRSWKPTKEDDVPHVWFPPKRSKILELKGYEITPTDQFSADVTLRFPRVVKIRYDKSWFECETKHAVQTLGRSFKTLNNAVKAVNISLEQLEQPKTKRRKIRKKVNPTRGSKPKVQQEFCIVDLSGVRITSGIFKGYGFHVVPCRDYDRGNGVQELQRKLFAAGATLLANPGDLLDDIKDHYIIAASARSHKVKNLVLNGHQDIYAPAWVDYCIQKGRMVQPQPSMIINATPVTQERLREFVDCFGDSFVDSIDDVSSLKQVFKAMERNQIYLPVPRPEVINYLKGCDAEVQDEIDTYAGFCLHRFTIYGDMYEKVQCSESFHLSTSESAAPMLLQRVASFASSFTTESSKPSARTSKHSCPAGKAQQNGSSSARSRLRQDAEQLLDKHSGLKVKDMCLRLQGLGAKISPTLGPGVTHVLVDPKNMYRKATLQAQLLKLREAQYQNEVDSFSCRVVSLAWAQQCLEWHSPHVDPQQYIVSLT